MSSSDAPSPLKDHGVPDAKDPAGPVDVSVIDDPVVAAAALDPIRGKILSALSEPGSATTVAATLGLPRQKVNYHLRALEENGLVSLVEERPRRGLTERIVVASARSYVLSPDVLGQNAADPARTDRLSSRYLIALAARMVREVADLTRRADQQNKRLATLSIDTEIRFGSAADQTAFANELAESVRSLAARYHDEGTAGGRWHRLVVAAHPTPTTATAATATPATAGATNDASALADGSNHLMNQEPGDINR